MRFQPTASPFSEQFPWRLLMTCPTGDALSYLQRDNNYQLKISHYDDNGQSESEKRSSQELTVEKR